MRRKFSIIAIITLILSLLFVSYTFANTDGIKNMTKNAGEMVKNAADDFGKGVESVANGIGGAVKDGTNAIMNTEKRMGNDIKSGVDDVMDNDNMNSNNGYTAQRTTIEPRTTSTTGANDAIFLGMSSTMWTWLIIGLTAIGIIAIITFYVRQNNATNVYKNNNHDDK